MHRGIFYLHKRKKTCDIKALFGVVLKLLGETKYLKSY